MDIQLQIPAILQDRKKSFGSERMMRMKKKREEKKKGKAEKK